MTTRTPLPKSYDHKEAERRWQQHWHAHGTYHFHDDLPRDQTFVIDTPPPTVSGMLHMGHIFSYTQADIIARYQRMQGKDVFYPMGFDDNGLPTERLVEKVKGKKAAQYATRAEFIAECQSVVTEAEEEFRTLFKSVALSVDWRKEYQTISDEVRALSQASFIDLMQKGRAYRQLQPMLWDPVDQTAIAQAEIEDKELASTFNDITFTVEGSGAALTIATTRPELLGACVALLYHPEDARYTALAGKHAITPLFGARVPILADENVKIDKGTGLVMCCTFGDETDILWWRTHKLDTRIILNKYGKLEFSDNIRAQYKDAAAADALTNLKAATLGREKAIELLKAAGVLTKQEPIKHAVKCAERSGAPLEILPTHQWFIKILDVKEQLRARARECTWHPDYMRLRIEQWIDGLSWDWCISRQRFFGVPFPVWYSKRPGEEGKILLAEPSQLPVDPFTDLPAGYTADEVTPDTDVMDTWATSSLTPEINAKSLTPNKLFPADLRPQAHEIIRSWAFYTLVKAELHAQTIPWKHLMISGWVLAADKQKMSKSKGNVVTPVALIEEKGADAVRYWASTARLGADTAFSEDALKIGRKLQTKLWNASQLVAMVLTREGVAFDPQAPATEALDQWVISRLHRCINNATQAFEAFEYADARSAVEDFFWNDFCDNYLELVKARAYDNNSSALATLYRCLDAILRLFAPILPHVTEEIFSHLFAAAHSQAGSLHGRNMWPAANAYPLNEQAEKAGIACVAALEIVRKAKSEAGVSIKVPVASLTLSADMLNALTPTLEDLRAAASITGEVKAGDTSVTLAKEAGAA